MFIVVEIVARLHLDPGGRAGSPQQQQNPWWAPRNFFENGPPLSKPKCYCKTRFLCCMLGYNELSPTTWVFQGLFCFQHNSACIHVQSLPNVLENLQHFLDCLINILLSPSPPLLFKTVLVFGRYTSSKHCNLPADNSHRCIRSTQHCFKEGWVVILRCRPETYYCHVKCFI